MPYTLEEGDNQHFKVSSEIRTIDWKRTALAAALDPSLKINNMIAMALKNSKEEFRHFCHLLSKSDELGRVSCIAELTRGRFRTRIAEIKQFENLSVKNNQEVVSVLVDCLLEWENLKPTAAELLNEMERDLDWLIRELKEGLQTLSKEVYDQNITQCKLRSDCWSQLLRVSTTNEREIRWFIIKSEKNLEKELTELYRDIAKYNSSIDNLLSLGEYRTSTHFKNVNVERQKLHKAVEQMVDRLSSLRVRYIS